jgi:thiamine-monophosphate kinase
MPHSSTSNRSISPNPTASALGEFGLIERYFNRAQATRNATTQATQATKATKATKATQATQATVVLGIGDDCALLSSTPGHHWAVSTDTLVEGRHFFANVDPVHLGHKALAVNLSDLAACGATPRCFTLGLTLPHVNEAWLSGFSRGLLALADQYDCTLVGGDTTQGPLNIAITVMGEVPQGQALRRSGARVGDDIWVSGTLGDARLGLEVLQGKRQLNHLSHMSSETLQYAQHRLECPTPRVALGVALRGVATSAIDLSDGLLGDLAHLLKSSGLASSLGAEIHTDWLEGASDAISPFLKNLEFKDRLSLVLSGGDDYELLFTAPPSFRQTALALAKRLQTPLTRIGAMVPEEGLRVLGSEGQEVKVQQHSYEHFS